MDLYGAMMAQWVEVSIANSANGLGFDSQWLKVDSALFYALTASALIVSSYHEFWQLGFLLQLIIPNITAISSEFDSMTWSK